MIMILIIIIMTTAQWSVQC